LQWSKGVRALIILLIGINLFFAYKWWVSANHLTEVTLEAGNLFAGNMTEYLYQGELRMIGDKSAIPESYRNAYQSNLRILSKLNIKAAEELSSAVGGRAGGFQDLSGLDADRFVYQLAISYPLSFALGESRLLGNTKDFESQEKRIKLINKLKSFSHSKKGLITELMWTIDFDGYRAEHFPEVQVRR